VTTCIAATFNPFWLVKDGKEVGPFIVVASDTRLSFGGYCSVEGTIKNKNFHRDWSAMIAGSDISQAIPVLDAATELLRGKSGKFPLVFQQFKKAYADYRRTVMTDIFLNSFDMTMAEFKRNGKKQLNTEVHADLSFRIRNFDLGCIFLVYGFDDHGEPHIFTVSNPGKAEVYDKPGFWAIGAGKSVALSMLAALGQHPQRNSLAHTVYNVLAAKYTSESASDVGPETWMFVHKKGHSAFIHEPKLEETVKSIWQKEGRPKTNEKAVKAIEESDITFLPFPRGIKRLALRRSKDQR
jgi:ATP-dependent protease HslVU (ClpYQ) peptidase subunit